MGLERRGWVIAVGVESTGDGKSSTFNGRRQPSGDGTSRMMREYQVRICEGLGVKFPGPTRHLQTRAPQQVEAIFDHFGSGDYLREVRCETLTSFPSGLLDGGIARER